MNAEPSDVDHAQAASIARSLVGLLESARVAMQSGPPSAVTQRISDHLGVDARTATVVSHQWHTWEHLSVHRGVAAYLAAESPQAEWFGLPGTNMRAHTDLATLLQMDPTSRPGSADYLLLACGPDAT